MSIIQLPAPARRLIVETNASSCYFRTSVEGDGRKALIQITERCNLHCAHCFVSSTAEGSDMPLADIINLVLPRLLRARVSRVTLTGGEPFVHPHFMEICQAIVDSGMSLGICTNATQTFPEQIAQLKAMGGVHVNISFDGFRAESHGKFRGNQSSFAVTKATAKLFAEAGLLQGLLSTPNILTRVDEFKELCQFALELGADYVLMNPLSLMGRGVKSQEALAAPNDMMNAIREATAGFNDKGLDTVHIRFPNPDKPLGGCDAGKLIYVFTDGQTAVCPYLVFAARTPQSKHPDTDFLAGNILQNEVAGLLDTYEMSKLKMGTNDTCSPCSLNASCGKGCPAAVVANGGRIGELDAEQCPQPFLQIGPRPI